MLTPPKTTTFPEMTTLLKFLVTSLASLFKVFQKTILTSNLFLLELLSLIPLTNLTFFFDHCLISEA